jgi:hypothetical protein
MKFGKWLSTAALSLFLLFGTGALIQAQEQRDDSKSQQDEAKPNQQEPRHDAGKSKPEEPRQGEAKPAEQNEDKPARAEEKRNQGEDKSMKQQDNSRREQQKGDHAQANSGRRGGHIPDQKFRSSFGREHRFKVQRPTVVQGQPTFRYGGYSFLIVDAWPGDWAYTDDVYIDYIDGEYFLFDFAHPDVRLAIVVVM